MRFITRLHGETEIITPTAACEYMSKDKKSESEDYSKWKCADANEDYCEAVQHISKEIGIKSKGSIATWNNSEKQKEEAISK